MKILKRRTSQAFNINVECEIDNDGRSEHSFNPCTEYDSESLAPDLKPLSDFFSSFNPLADVCNNTWNANTEVGDQLSSNINVECENNIDEMREYFASFNPYTEHESESLELKPTGNFFSTYNPLADVCNSDDVDDTDLNRNKVSYLEENAITYIAGYVCHRLFIKYDCNNCKAIILQSDDTGNTKSNIYLKEKG